jgi:hypothetical protein
METNTGAKKLYDSSGTRLVAEERRKKGGILARVFRHDSFVKMPIHAQPSKISRNHVYSTHPSRPTPVLMPTGKCQNAYPVEWGKSSTWYPGIQVIEKKIVSSRRER